MRSPQRRPRRSSAVPSWSNGSRPSAQRSRARSRPLERYYEAFERGKLSPERCEERLTRVQARLDDLRAPRSRTLAPSATRGGTRAHSRRPRRRRRRTRPRHRRRRAAEGEGTTAAAHRGTARQRSGGDPPHLPHRHARGLRNVRKSGRNRTLRKPGGARRADAPRRLNRLLSPADSERASALRRYERFRGLAARR